MECRADFADEVREVGELSVESIGKRHFRGVAWSRDVKAPLPAPLEASLSKTGLKDCRGRSFGLEGELKLESKMEIPDKENAKLIFSAMDSFVIKQCLK